jgi:hypothetical protein
MVRASGAGPLGCKFGLSAAAHAVLREVGFPGAGGVAFWFSTTRSQVVRQQDDKRGTCCCNDRGTGHARGRCGLVTCTPSGPTPHPPHVSCAAPKPTSPELVAPKSESAGLRSESAAPKSNASERGHQSGRCPYRGRPGGGMGHEPWERRIIGEFPHRSQRCSRRQGIRF